MNMASNCDVTKTAHQQTNENHIPVNETPPNENFLRTPLDMPIKCSHAINASLYDGARIDGQHVFTSQAPRLFLVIVK